ncbi:hypothetical protein AMELA_G00284700, partial [Ameiurus melas]
VGKGGREAEIGAEREREREKREREREREKKFVSRLWRSGDRPSEDRVPSEISWSVRTLMARRKSVSLITSRPGLRDSVPRLIQGTV